MPLRIGPQIGFFDLILVAPNWLESGFVVVEASFEDFEFTNAFGHIDRDLVAGFFVHKGSSNGRRDREPACGGIGFVFANNRVGLSLIHI